LVAGPVGDGLDVFERDRVELGAGELLRTARIIWRISFSIVAYVDSIAALINAKALSG
jgi:hypothetical protein